METKIIIKMALLILIIIAYSEAGMITYKSFKDSIITKFKISPWRPTNYRFEYETSLGTARRENGVLKKASNGKPYLAIVGFYRYRTPSDQIYHVDYIADEKGFRPMIKVLNKNDENLEKSTTESSDDNIHFPEDVSTMSPLFKSNLQSDTSLRDQDIDSPTILQESDDGLGNRFGLPPGVVGSLLG